MNATPSRNRAPVVRPVHLRYDVFDAMCAARDAYTYAKRAELFGIDGKTIWRLCNHEAEATVSTALHICRKLDTSVDALFGTDAKSARDLVKSTAA